MRLFAAAAILGGLLSILAMRPAGTAGLAQGSPNLAPAPVSTSGTIAGIVTDGASAPMTGVTVELVRRDEIVASTQTDAAGRFTFEHVPPGVYQVRALRPGLVPAAVHVAVTDQPVPTLRLALGVEAGSEESDVRLSRHRAEAARIQVGGAPAAPAESMAVGGRVAPHLAPPPADFHTATYDRIEDNRFRRVADAPLSTFSIDVDTASYSNVRRFLNQGTLPPAGAVRTEELINYFRFGYAEPRGETPFSITTDVAPCPWNPRNRLVLVGLQARHERQDLERPKNLVFLLDVSGSMMPPERLPLVKTAMRMLVDTLTARDRVAIVVYAGASGLVLPSTPGDRKADIHHAIASLAAGGSTNGAAGIQLAYDTAASAFVRDGVNRVILATDGDFNVGVTSQGELIRLIERQRERGIFLSVLGVGTNNLKDSTMEKLADRGNGNYAYLDSLHEARRVLIEQAGATLVTVAKDVKIQVEFNPRTVGAYRLVGYENRLLNAEDFNDDRKDAGEMGAGHTVTALYEVTPAGETAGTPSVDPLKYQEAGRPVPTAHAGELMTVKVRYKQPEGDASRLVSAVVRERDGRATPALGFAAAIAQFGMLLRESEFKGEATWRSTQALARQHRGEDPDGYRAEFVRLVDLAAALQAQAGDRLTRH